MTTDNKQTRRRFLKATGGVAAGAALAGCSSSSGDGSGNNSSGSGGNNSGGGGTSSGNQSGGNQGTQSTQSIEADPSKTLQLINDTVTTFDPVAATDTASGRVIQNVFDALMNYPHGEVEV